MVNGICLKNALISGANNILKNKIYVNELNIFPVPDGDTGTNMSMTICSPAEELKKLNDDCLVKDVVKTFVPSLLRNARGNSGVILSLLFRGFSKLFSDYETLTGFDIVQALHLGVEGAYAAVTKPTEGTILTVARIACEKGKIEAKTNSDIVNVWSAVCQGAQEALKSTPDLLPVLKKAGVVDAGGKGLCLIFEGMLSVFKDGIIMDCESSTFDEQIQNDDVFKNAAAEFDQDITFTYCTEFIVKRNRFCRFTPLKLRSKLQKIGDCVVVVDDEEIIKVHVHTENPGKVLQEGLRYGQFLTVKVENMKEQHRLAVESQQSNVQESENDVLEVKNPENAVGFVAVAAGDGLISLFKDIGCENVISGGQTMNPSTEKIVEAVLATPAKTVYVFPNNKNIIMSAQQAVSLVKDRALIVVPTKTIAQGISSVLAYNEDLGSDENLDLMTKEAQKVKTGQVTFAARDSEFGGFKIKEKDILGLSDGKLTVVEKDPIKALVRLAKSMTSKTTEFITLIYGESITSEQAQKAEEAIKSALKSSLEINVINGGQPVYHFILSVE